MKWRKKEMRKMVKMGMRKNQYYTCGEYRASNIRYKFYRILFDAIKLSDTTYNDMLRNTNKYRRVCINDCLYMPLDTIYMQMKHERNSYINLGYNTYVNMSEITKIIVF